MELLPLTFWDYLLTISNYSLPSILAFVHSLPQVNSLCAKDSPIFFSIQITLKIVPQFSNTSHWNMTIWRTFVIHEAFSFLHVGKEAMTINMCEYSSGRDRRIMFNCILVMPWNVEFFFFFQWKYYVPRWWLFHLIVTRCIILFGASLLNQDYTKLSKLAV